MCQRKIKTMSVLVLAACLLFGGQAQAILLGFSPTTQNVNAGDSVDIDLVISDLGNGIAPSLSVFDLDVLYDSTILGLTNVSFGDPVLGDQLDVFGFGLNPTATAAVAGGTNLFELSLDFPADLDFFQPGSFTLARLTFDVLAVGTSALDLANVVLGDSLGDPLAASVDPGSVTAAPVPEPSALTLLGLGFVGVGFTRRRKANDQKPMATGIQ